MIRAYPMVARCSTIPRYGLRRRRRSCPLPRSETSALGAECRLRDHGQVLPIPIRALLRTPSRRARSLQPMDAASVCDNDGICLVNEKSGFDHPHHAPKLNIKACRVWNGAEVAIQNKISTIGAIRLALGIQPQAASPAEPLNFPGRGLPTKGDNLDGHRQRKLLGKLCPVGHNEHPGRRARHNLLAQQCPAHPFDEMETRTRDLVGSIDGEVDLGMLAEIREWNTVGPSLRCGTL